MGGTWGLGDLGTWGHGDWELGDKGLEDKDTYGGTWSGTGDWRAKDSTQSMKQPFRVSNSGAWGRPNNT